MIWGDEGGLSEVPTVLPRSESPAGEDWVLIGHNSPAPGDLGALEPLHPDSDSSTASSSAPSEAGDDAPRPGHIANRSRPNHPSTRLATIAAAELKSVKSAQLIKQRSSGKALSSKALKRTNKCSLADGGRRQNTFRSNFPIKMAGSKNLKQC